MPTAWDDGFQYDREIAEAMASAPVQNGEIARGQWPITADVLQVAALVGIPPAAGVACELDTTAQVVRLIAPPFASTARLVVIAGGDGVITATVTSGGSGSASITMATDSTDRKDCVQAQSADLLTITGGDTTTVVAVEIDRDSTGVQAFAVALLFGGFAL